MSDVCHTFEHAGLRVQIVRDNDAGDPWKDADCMTPRVTFYQSLDVEDSGDGVLDFFAHVSPAWVSRNWRKICGALGLDEARHDKDARIGKADWGGDLCDIRLDQFREVLNELTPSRSWGGWRAAEGYLNALEALWNLLGVQTFSRVSRGYSQGDAAHVLLIATPAHLTRCGLEAETQAGLESEFDTYSAWAWGDCYGFKILDDEGDELDSCWGFVECYWSKGADSYRLAEARREAECEAGRQARENANRMAAEIEAARPDLAPQWESRA